MYILFLTFFAYTCYHMSRKPISVVKTRLLNCTELGNTTTCTSFISKCRLTHSANDTEVGKLFFLQTRSME